MENPFRIIEVAIYNIYSIIHVHVINIYTFSNELINLPKVGSNIYIKKEKERQNERKKPIYHLILCSMYLLEKYKYFSINKKIKTSKSNLFSVFSRMR